MTLMDVEIGHARPARSPDKKAARDYLIASGASAISVIDNETGCTFATGKLNPRAAVVFWLPDGEARAVVKLARRAAGKKPDIAAATSALQRADADQRVTLTTHDVAMTRAGDALVRLDGYLEAMRRSGQLAEFNKQYKRHRMAAGLRGEGFMSFATAMARLRAALIPMLVNDGRQPMVGATMFAEIFRS